MIFVTLAVGIIIGLIRGGKFSNARDLKLVRPWLIFLSVILEASLNILMKNDLGITQFMVFLWVCMQYLLLFLFIWFNRNLPYIWIIGIGTFLNALVILLNSGSMPLIDISPYIGATETPSQYLLDGKLLSYHIINENTKLWFLGDIIWVPSPFRAFASIGDIFLYGGVLLLLQHIIAGKSSAKKAPKKKQSA